MEPRRNKPGKPRVLGSAFKKEGSAFSKSVPIEGIVAKRWEDNSTTRGRTRKSKFLPWSTFPAHKN